MIAIRNAQLPNDKIVDIIIEGSKVQRVIEPTGLKDGIDATGLVIVPGGIDPHVHFRMPGQEWKEDWLTGSAAAIKGGITTVLDMPNTLPVLITILALECKRRIVAGSGVEARFWFGATKYNIKEIIAASYEPDIIGVKVFMGSSTGDLLVRQDIDLMSIFHICAVSGLIVGVHAEDEALMLRNRASLGREPHVSDHCFIRNEEVEISAVKRALNIARITGCKLYLCHLSTPGAVELALEARERGQTVYIEVSPHHIILDERRLKENGNSFFKMNPPLRKPENVLCLRELVCNGSVDTIGSDHAPHTREEKQREGYDNIPSGVPGVETLMPLLFNLVSEGRMTMEQFVKLTSGNAARIFGLDSKGRIEEGCDADLVLIDPNQYVTIQDIDIAAKCGWTPFNGFTVKGEIRHTIVQGVIT